MATFDGKDVDFLSELMQEKLTVDETVNMKHKLCEAECPFSWQLPSLETNTVDQVRRTELKLEQMKDEDEEFIYWKTFILNIVLCHQYTVKGSASGPPRAAFEKLSECETALNTGNTVPFFSSEGLKHIIQATRAFLLMYSKKYEEAEDILSCIQQPKTMDKKCEATICGARASVLMEYGYEGMKESVIYVEKAIELDPDCTEWHFLLGRALGRLRRIDARTSIPDQRELKALEKACALTPCSAFLALLAQSYRETSRSIFFNPNCDRKIFQPYCNTLNKKSVDIYRKLMDEAGDNVHVNIRCAQGFLKFPKPYRDFSLAKKCIERALSISPENTFAHHVAGTYYSMINDTERAIKHFKLSAEAGNYGACMDLVSLQYKSQLNFDPVPELKRMYERFLSVGSYREDILCNLGAVFYFERNDFKNALEYWLKVIEENINSEKLKVFISGLVNRRDVNINEIIVQEIISLLNGSELNMKEKELYNLLLAQYSKYHPDLVKSISKQKQFSWKISEKSNNSTFQKDNVSKKMDGRDTNEENTANTGSTKLKIPSPGNNNADSKSSKISCRKKKGKTQGANEN